MDVLSKLKTSKARKLTAGEAPPSKEDILNAMESFDPDGTVSNKENNNNSDHSLSTSSVDGRWTFVEPDTASTPASLSHSYSLEWNKLFCSHKDLMRWLKKRATDGDLRSSRFRSLVWKLFLEVLPADMDQWVEKTRQNRTKFEELKKRLIINPRKAVDAINLSLNNPLSQDEESPWNKFFQDNELRLTIKQDVIRTFPEVEFFRSGNMGEMMLDILFCYSREHATHSYKQGMHELLAPLIFVLHCDHQAFLHACEIESVLYCSQATRNVMKEVMDPAYLEHDAYSMFCQVMETVEPWYLSRELLGPRSGSLRCLEIINATPFARSQDLNPSNAIVTKLTRIQDYVLKKFDPELHMHLERLEIAPQIYGIRWLRLLFGREFPMQDLLMLWDAIFGDGIGFDLVDYIFVAMLLYIRDVLLASDYASCLCVLMKFPPVPDVHYFVEKAVWLREPNQSPRPPNYTHQGSIKTSSSMGSGSHLESLPPCRDVSAKDHTDSPCGSTVSLSQVEESMYRHTPSASSLARLEPTSLRSAQSSPGVHQAGIFPLTPDDASVISSPTKSNTLPNKSKVKAKKMTKVERELQEQVQHMQGQLNDNSSMCRYCASKLDVHIGRLQNELNKQHLDSEDDIMLSLAGLKLVRDVLNGTLKFTQTIADEEEEILINDDYYGNEDSAASSMGHNPGSGVLSPESDILPSAKTSAREEQKSADQGHKLKLFYMSSDDTSPDTSTPGGGVASPPSHAHLLTDSSVELHEYNSHPSLPRGSAGSVGEDTVDGSSSVGSSQLSRIRSIFKSTESKKKAPPPLSGGRAVDEVFPVSVSHRRENDEGVMKERRRSRDGSSDREVGSNGVRRRTRTSGDLQQAGTECGPPPGIERQNSKGSYSEFVTGSEGRASSKDMEKLSRGRSKSQPVTAKDSLNHFQNVNPLYTLQYEQHMEY